MKEQFNQFKDSLASTESPGTEQGGSKKGGGGQGNSTKGTGRGRSLRVGEEGSKAERRAGEDPSGVHSGMLKIDAHPIPVTFTSLPGFPRPVAPPSRTPSIAPSPSPSGPIGEAPLVVETRLDVPSRPGIRPRPRPERPSAGRGASRGSQVGDLMRLLESRLIGGLRASMPGVRAPPGQTTHQFFDPSIVVNFLTLVALSQQR